MVLTIGHVLKYYILPILWQVDDYQSKTDIVTDFLILAILFLFFKSCRTKYLAGSSCHIFWLPFRSVVKDAVAVAYNAKICKAPYCICWNRPRFAIGVCYCCYCLLLDMFVFISSFVIQRAWMWKSIKLHFIAESTKWNNFVNVWLVVQYNKLPSWNKIKQEVSKMMT